MPKNLKDCYEILNLPSDVTPTIKDVKQSFKKSMLLSHPDKAKNSEEKSKFEAKAASISDAYHEIMKDHYASLDKPSLEIFKKQNRTQDTAEKKNNIPIFVNSYSPRLSRQSRRLFRISSSEKDSISIYSKTDFNIRSEKGTAVFRIQGDRDYQEDFATISYDIPIMLQSFDRNWINYILSSVLKEIQQKYLSTFYTCGAAFCSAFTWRTKDEKDREVAQVITVHVGDVLPIAIIKSKSKSKTKKIEVKRLVEPHNPKQGKSQYLNVNNYGINLTRSMGDVCLQKAELITYEPEVNFHSFLLENGDTFQLMVASDGFTDYVDDKEIAEIASNYQHKTIYEQINRHGNFAYAYKNSSDNITTAITLEKCIAMLVTDGHGGTEVAEILSKVFFNELKQKMVDILSLSEDVRKKLMEDLNNKKNIISLKNEKRIKKIAELCDLKVAEHKVSYEKPSYFPKDSCLIIATNLSHSLLLEDIEAFLITTGLSYSPQEEYYDKGYNRNKYEPPQFRLIIPLGKIEELPDILDIFLMYLENSFKYYVPPPIKINKNTPLSFEGIKDITSRETTEAIEKIFDGLEKKSLNGRGWDCTLAQNITLIPEEKLKLKSFTTEKIPKSELSISSSVPALTFIEKNRIVPLTTDNESSDSLDRKIDKSTLTFKKYSLVPLSIENKIESKEKKSITYVNIHDSIKFHFFIPDAIKKASGMSGGASGSETVMGEIQNGSNEQNSVVIKISDQVGKTKMNVSVLDFLTKQTPPCPYVMKLKGVTYSKFVTSAIVMDNAELGTLDRFLHAFSQPGLGRIPYPILLKIAHDITQGLAYLHRLGITHGDLRSEQIFLDKDLTAKIGGFSYSFDNKDDHECGSAMSVASGGDGSVYANITPERMDLDLVRSEKYSEDDVYALGHILREVFDVSHRKAFSGIGSSIGTLNAIAQGRKELIPANCPPCIQKIIKKCWERHPQNRYNAEELAAVFNKLISETPAKEYNYKITFPAEYLIRTMGQHTEYFNEQLEDSSSEEKLIDLLFKTSLLTPQSFIFVKEIIQVEHLWKEYQLLVKLGLDNEENFSLIKKYLSQNTDSEVLIAEIIILITACSFKSTQNNIDYCDALLQSKNKINIYNILVFLFRSESKSTKQLCHYRNFLSLICLEKCSENILKKLYEESELNQTIFDKILQEENKSSVMPLEYKEKEYLIATPIPLNNPSIEYISSDYSLTLFKSSSHNSMDSQTSKSQNKSLYANKCILS